MNRRQFFYLISTGFFLGKHKPTLANDSKSTNVIQKSIYLSAGTDLLGNNQISAITAQGDIIFIHPMPSRGHGFAIDHANQYVFCISRRPENTIDVVRFNGQLITQIKTGQHRHLYGHAACSHDGYLYTPENNWQNGEGIICVRHTSNNTFECSQEFPCYGTGPHELVLSHDQQYIIVANGGIKTHPDTGRKKLNINTMRSSLTIIQRATGKLVKHIYLPEQQRYNSIRHLSVTHDNIIFAALQNQSNDKRNEVLLIKHDLKRNITTPFKIPLNIQSQLKGYVGSIALDQSEQIIAASCPKGGYLLFYNRKGSILGYAAMQDACGIQRGNSAGTFIATSGTGLIRRYYVKLNEKKITYVDLAHHQDIQWDNHLLRI